MNCASARKNSHMTDSQQSVWGGFSHARQLAFAGANQVKAALARYLRGDEN
jgi:hypothetical protein